MSSFVWIDMMHTSSGLLCGSPEFIGRPRLCASSVGIEFVGVTMVSFPAIGVRVLLLVHCTIRTERPSRCDDGPIFSFRLERAQELVLIDVYIVGLGKLPAQHDDEE